jgi:hypothetical protein
VTAPRCPACESPLVEISIVREVDTVSMRSCSTCDRRWWHRDGAPVDLDDVFPVPTRRQAAGA